MTSFVFRTDRLYPAVAYWPDGDRDAFTTALAASRGPFGSMRHLRSAASLEKAKQGYARYLRFLADIGDLGIEEQPRERVTPPRLDRYLRHLQARNAAGATILGLFESIRAMLQLIYPALDVRWIVRPGGVHLKRLLSVRRIRSVAPIDSAVLLTWAEELFAQAIAARSKAARCYGVRDAVIIGILAERAPRRRALSLLQIGDGLVHDDAGWQLREHAETTKTRKPIHVRLSPRLNRMLDRYIAVERRDMLGRCETAAAWVTFGGELTVRGITTLVRMGFERRFGVQRGPHFFRHCLATTLADRLPDHPMDGATMLGHGSPATTLRFYNHTTKVACAQRVEALLASLRPAFTPGR